MSKLLVGAAERNNDEFSNGVFRRLGSRDHVFYTAGDQAMKGISLRVLVSHPSGCATGCAPGFWFLGTTPGWDDLQAREGIT